jgi:hypothetical protein
MNKRKVRYWNELRGRVHEPLLVDRRIDIAAAVSWLLIGIWGVFNAISKYTAVAEVAGDGYNALWGMAIGILGLVAGISAASTLINSRSIPVRILKKRTELWSLSLMTGLVSVTPLLRYTMVIEHFRADTIAGAAITTFFLVFPTWRIFHLTERIRGLRKIAES